MLTPPATRERPVAADAPPPSSAAAALLPWAVLAWSAAAGIALGVAAAVADGRGGALSDLLSVPGPWIAGAAAVAVAASACGRGWCAPAATAGFLLTGIAAYYLTKQSTMGSTPGPLVVFWGGLAVAVGVGIGVASRWCAAHAWGVPAIAGAVAGWLVVEVVVLPAAPSAEALAGLVGVGLVSRGTEPRARRWRAVALGASAGALAAACVFSVLSRALSAAL